MSKTVWKFTNECPACKDDLRWERYCEGTLFCGVKRPHLHKRCPSCKAEFLCETATAPPPPERAVATGGELSTPE